MCIKPFCLSTIPPSKKKRRTLPECKLNINITERSSNRRHRVRNRDTRGIHTEIDEILQSPVSAGRAVVQGDCARDGVLSVGDILVLPNPPRAVNLCMMEEKCRVAGASEDISTRVAADCEMTSGVDAIHPVGEVALHDGLEPVDVGVLLN